MNWNWQVIMDSLPTLMMASLTTIGLVIISGILGLLLAIPLGLARVSKKWWVQTLPFGFIFFFRGTPLLVQIFLIYYGLGQFIPDGLKDGWLWTKLLSKPYFWAIVAFTLNTAAYTAEIVRGAIKAIPKGENEAADAIGMSYAQKFKRIIMPRAFGIMLPAYSNEVIFMLKGSALASTISIMDLTGQAKTLIAKTYATLELYFAAGVIYLVLSWVFISLFRMAEKHFNRHLNYQPISKVNVTA
ncbi:basic amino acid ABC transporter inner membrane protein [Moraxella macacae 0408225]|uniref:Arginine ABC transporter permease protein ArtM n=1 Tax=Moraxella macacae 0408225 TaxID=1230338 RepID=L2F6E1_9GAMM|nr:ABC transporter permease [Moraxella macacae]ELA08366.1 basic amino acid ABC transporter inner membrane protein [Moraxella macacae 0408225]